MDKIKTKFFFPKDKPNYPEKLTGWLADGNQLLLKKYVSSDMKIIIEFGSWLGLSADYILRHANSKCKLICVDMWQGDTSIGKAKDSNELYNTFLVNMWKYKDRLTPVKMDGRKAMKYLYESGIKPDMIYLDMDHSYEAVIDDLKVLMKYFPETLILGDDILYWPGVARAVKEITSEYDIYKLEINQNCYALIPEKYTKRYEMKGIILKTVNEDRETDITNKIAIIIGYHPSVIKNDKLVLFVKNLIDFMKKTDQEFHIFIIQKPKDTKLNLGLLNNIGYDISEKLDYNVFIFHNIDLLPNEDMLKYYKIYPENPIQLGYNLNEYIYQKYYMGTMMFNSDDFESINGYSNNIIGWNGWDHELYLRLKTTDIPVEIPLKGTLQDKDYKLPTMEEWNKLKDKKNIRNHMETWNKNGLYNLEYTIQSKTIINKYCSIYKCK